MPDQLFIISDNNNKYRIIYYYWNIKKKGGYFVIISMENNRVNNIHLIAAIDEEGGIGKDGTIPWHFKEDMQYFKNLTKGAGDNAVIMGRKTFESLNYKPLPQRINIILSKSVEIYQQFHYPDKGTLVLPDIAHALHYVDERLFDDVWVIGGYMVYYDFLTCYNNRVKNIYLTHISCRYDCDVFFPHIPNIFSVYRLHHTLDNGTLLKFKVYGKIHS